VSEQEAPREGRDGAPTPTAELEAEVARLEDRSLRALADLDNYRKRAAREIERRTAEATDALVADWLEVADSVERAAAALAGDRLAEGLQAVRGQIESTLIRQGVQRFGEPGEPFDPARHEAVDVRQVDDVPDHTVVDVVRPGYERDGRVLRPAQVAVSQRPRADGAPEQPVG
jgi:molecular chaperone GrpE